MGRNNTDFGDSGGKSPVYTLGSKFVNPHQNVDKDPYLGHCAVCGKKVSGSVKLLRTDLSAKINPDAPISDAWLFAVGSDCAKKFSDDSFDTSDEARSYIG